MSRVTSSNRGVSLLGNCLSVCNLWAQTFVDVCSANTLSGTSLTPFCYWLAWNCWSQQKIYPLTARFCKQKSCDMTNTPTFEKRLQLSCYGWHSLHHPQEVHLTSFVCLPVWKLQCQGVPATWWLCLKSDIRKTHTTTLQSIILFLHTEIMLFESYFAVVMLKSCVMTS